MNAQLYDLALFPLEQTILKEKRKKLLAHASGKVLEIGVGTGINFSFYPPQTVVTGIEPDSAMLKRAKLGESVPRIQVYQASAEDLPFTDESFDTVVGTLVFCTIPNLDKAVNEIFRVLRPGGKLLLLEHIRKDSPVVGKLQDLATHLWKRVAGGCHLNRNPKALLLKRGFIQQAEASFWKGVGKEWIFIKPQKAFYV